MKSINKRNLDFLLKSMVAKQSKALVFGLESEPLSVSWVRIPGKARPLKSLRTMGRNSQ